MSKRGDELRRLMNIPPPADVKVILDSLDKQSDRAAALVAGGLLDTALERLIRHSLKVKDRELVNQLFQQRGPMGDLHSKIIVATAFGVVKPEVSAELNIIRSVRNVFAHATANLTFETPEISEAIERSALARIFAQAIGAGLKAGINKSYAFAPTPGWKFFTLVRLLFALLDRKQKELSGLALSE